MDAKTVDVHEAQHSLPELVALAIAGTEIILTEGSTPIARLVPLKTAGGKRVAGLHPGSASVSDDFDAPLPEDFWLGSA